MSSSVFLLLPPGLDEPHALTRPMVSATTDAPPTAVVILPGIVPPV
jgi:hypothetical protein